MFLHEKMVIKDYNIPKLKEKWPKIGISLKNKKNRKKIGMLDALSIALLLRNDSKPECAF